MPTSRAVQCCRCRGRARRGGALQAGVSRARRAELSRRFRLGRLDLEPIRSRARSRRTAAARASGMFFATPRARSRTATPATSPATIITAGARISTCSRAAASPPIAFRRPGRASCRPAPARSNARGLDFYDRLVDGLLARRYRAVALPLSLGFAAGACRTRAAGSVATLPKNSPTMRASWHAGSATASSIGRCSTSPMSMRCSGTASAVTRPASPACRTCSPPSITRTWRMAARCGAARGARRPTPRHGIERCSRRGRPRTARKTARAAERFDAMWNGACLDPLLQGPLSGARSPPTSRR